MNIHRTLGILALLGTSSSLALADAGAGPAARPAAHASDDRTALPSLPLFDLPAQASDNARVHVGLAHARRDSHRAQHTRRAAANPAAASAHKKTAQRHLDAARERQAAAQARRDAAQLRRSDAQERRAAAAAERQLNAEARRAAAEGRRANVGK